MYIHSYELMNRRYALYIRVLLYAKLINIYMYVCACMLERMSIFKWLYNLDLDRS